MSTIANRRRPVLPQEERNWYRYYLFQEIRKRGWYLNDVRASLRPLWEAAVPDVGEMPRVRSWLRLVRLRFWLGASSPVGRYVGAVERYTAEQLRIRQGADSETAARWACAYVHSDVEPKSGADGLLEPDHDDPDEAVRPAWGFAYASERLRINVLPYEAEIIIGEEAPFRIPGPDGSMPDIPPGFPKRRIAIPAGVHWQWDEWDELRRAAHAELDTIFDDLRSEYRAQFPTGSTPNPSTLNKWRDNEAAEFATHLLRDTRPPDEATRKRLEARADLLVMDAPWKKRRKTPQGSPE